MEEKSHWIMQWHNQGKINGNEFKREYNITDDVEAMLQKSMLTRSQKKIV